MSEETLRAEEAGLDGEAFRPKYGKGGVPLLLLLFYLSFLVFFTWYTLEYQLPDYLDQGPITPAEAPPQR